MKTRPGFISNSSSSSFIVKFKIIESHKVTKILLDKKTEQKLIEYGFKQTIEIDPECYFGKKENINIKSMIFREINYGYDISCNQDEVITFLLKNDIPFDASCHYDDYRIIYDNKFVYRAENLGRQLRRYSYYYQKSIDKMAKELKKNCIVKMDKDKWLKEYGLEEELNV